MVPPSTRLSLASIGAESSAFFELPEPGWTGPIGTNVVVWASLCARNCCGTDPFYIWAYAACRKDTCGKWDSPDDDDRRTYIRTDSRCLRCCVRRTDEPQACLGRR